MIRCERAQGSEVFFTGRSAASFALTQVDDELGYLDDDDDDGNNDDDYGNDDDDSDDDGDESDDDSDDDEEEVEAKYSWNTMTMTIEL